MDGYTLPMSMCIILIYLEFLYYNLTMVQFKLEFTNTSTIVDQCVTFLLMAESSKRTSLDERS